MSDPGYGRSPGAHDQAFGEPELASPASSRGKKGSFRKRMKSSLKKALHLSGKDTSGQDTASTGTPTSPWPEHTDIDHTTPPAKTPRTPHRRVAVDATLDQEGGEHLTESAGGSATPSHPSPDAHSRRHKEHKGLGKLIHKCIKTDATSTDSGVANIAMEPVPTSTPAARETTLAAAPAPPGPQPAAPEHPTTTLEAREITPAAELPTMAPPTREAAEDAYADAADTLPLPAADVTAPFDSASSTTLPLSPVIGGDVIELPASTGPLGLSPSPVRTPMPALARLPSPTRGVLAAAATSASDRPPSPPPPPESLIADDAVLSSAPRQGPPPPIGVAAFEGHQLPTDLTEEEVAMPPPPALPGMTARTAPEVAAQTVVAGPAVPWSDQQQDMLAPADALGFPMHSNLVPTTAALPVTSVPDAADVAIQLPLPAEAHAPSPGPGTAVEVSKEVTPPAVLGEHAERAGDTAKLTHGDALRQHQPSMGSGAVSGAAGELPPPSEFTSPQFMAAEPPAKAGHGDALKASRSPTASSGVTPSAELPSTVAAISAVAERERTPLSGAARGGGTPLPSEALVGVPPLEQAELPSKAGHGDALTRPSAPLPASPAPLEVAGRAPHVVDAAKAAHGDALLSQAHIGASSFEAAFSSPGGDFAPYKLTHDNGDLDFRKMAVLPVTPTPTPNLSVSESLLHSDPAYGSPPRPGMLGSLVDGVHTGEAYKNAAPRAVQAPQYTTAPQQGAGDSGDLWSPASFGASQGLSKGLPSVPEQEPAAGDFAEMSEEPPAMGPATGFAEERTEGPEVYRPGLHPPAKKSEESLAMGPATGFAEKGAEGPEVYRPGLSPLGDISPNTLDGAKIMGTSEEADYGAGATGVTLEGAIPGAATELHPTGNLDREMEPDNMAYTPAGEEVPGPMEPYAVLARPLDSPVLQTSGSVSSSCGYLAMPPVAGLHVVKEGSAELEDEAPNVEEVSPVTETISTPALESSAAQQPTHDKIAPDEIRPVSKFESMEPAQHVDSSADKTSRNGEISSQLIPDVPKSFTATSTSASSSATTPRHPESTPPTPPGTPSVLTSLQQIQTRESKSAPPSRAAKGDLTTEYLKGQEEVSGAHLGGLTSFPAQDVSGEASAPETPAKAEERDVTAMYLKGQEDVEGAHLAGLTSFPTYQREAAGTESPRTEPPETPHSEVPEASLGSITVGGTASGNEIGDSGHPAEKREAAVGPEQEGQQTEEVQEMEGVAAKEVQQAPQRPRTWASALTVQAARTAGAATGIFFGFTKIAVEMPISACNAVSQTCKAGADMLENLLPWRRFYAY